MPTSWILASEKAAALILTARAPHTPKHTAPRHGCKVAHTVLQQPAVFERYDTVSSALESPCKTLHADGSFAG